ncbi:mucin-17-like [Phaenicophaeus curvirostris]|uniref:mucin-17-like n=1 Tax=Phaenicophaeus curvirostris TaxID=33595 RepID=UPI0037F0F74F
MRPPPPPEPRGGPRCGRRLTPPAASLPPGTAGGGTDTSTADTTATAATATASTATPAAATTDTSGAAITATSAAATTATSGAATTVTSAAATTATTVAATVATSGAATTAAATTVTSAAATTATTAAATTAAATTAAATTATTVAATTAAATTAAATTATTVAATIATTAAVATATSGAATSAAAAATATITAATTSPALLGDVGTVTPEPGAAVLPGAAGRLTRGPPAHLPTTVPGSFGQPSGPLGGPGSPPAAGDTALGELPSSPTGQVDDSTPGTTAAGRAPQVFIAEDQPPLLRASILRIPCELVLDMVFTPALQDPASHAHQVLLRDFNRTVAPLFAAVPGFLRLEVTEIREGSVVLAYDALFSAQQAQVPGLVALLDAVLGSVGDRPGLAVGAAPILRHALLERPLDPCAVLFACRAGFTCVAGVAGNATCTSLCHRDYCKNQGICTHAPERAPLCRCPVGSDFWFVGLRCDYRVTRQSLLGTAAGVLLSIVLLGAVAAAVVVRRFKALLLEARAEQTRSSYRRFCRLDDVSAQYWSRSRLPSASSLDNPAFSNSEELLHLQILDNGCCGCREDSGITGSSKHGPVPPARRPSFHYEWDMSSSSVNDPMVDSGKASDISVSSWPMEPTQWVPFPLLHQLSRQRPHRARRPRSYCEGMELGSLERSWTA